MKKTLLALVIVILVVVMSVSFASCSNKNQLQTIISEYQPWISAKMPESLTYEMSNSNNIVVGTYNMTVSEANTDSTIYLGKDGTSTSDDYIYSFTITNTSFHATTLLTLNDDSMIKKTESYFNSSFKLIASYSYEETKDGTTAIIAKNVNDDRYYYQKYENGVKTSENAIKNGKYEASPYYDNTMIYFMARSIPDSSDYSSFSFNIFDTDTNSKIKVSLSNSVSTTEDVTVLTGAESAETVSCRYITMTTSDGLLGITSTIKCYISKSSYKNYRSVICKITEGGYNYTLKVE